jgi:hypothetical protein
LLPPPQALGKERFPAGPDGRADHDGRHADHDAVWRRWFDVNRVETHTRRFGNRITTDGCSVSVLVRKQSCLVCPDGGDRWDPQELRRLLNEDRGRGLTRFCSVDPGFTDVVVTASLRIGEAPESLRVWGEAPESLRIGEAPESLRIGEAPVQSYSSARYYEKAHYNTSRRRTAAWNAQTAASVRSLEGVPSDTASLPALEQNARAYLAVLPGLLRHRSERGYRNMRFLRYVGKKRAVDEICELVAPKGPGVKVVGFGDWSGGHGTPVKRRCAGPLQEIKLQLRRREDVRFLSVRETNTSRTCHGCFHRLTNMRAVHTRVRAARDPQTGARVLDPATGKPTKATRAASGRRTKIHKVLHCMKSSQDGAGPLAGSPRCGATWNRDANAAKNLLMLMMLEILGIPRPAAFMAAGRVRGS